MSRCIRVGTRGSLLAMTQTRQVLAAVRERRPGVTFETVVIRTRGDTHKGRLPTVGTKGFFTKEIEDALLVNEVDFAVHSLKDLPAEMPPGLVIGCIPAREDPRDVLVGLTRDQLVAADRPKVGTCSLRRAAQLRRAFPGCRTVDLRGNIDTRLRKVGEKVVDAGILAMAGLRRLGLEREACDVFPPSEMLPAPGQGALGIEMREDDEETANLLASVHCSETAVRVQAERGFMHSLGGGCQVPVAALAEIRGDTLHLTGRVISLDGTRLLEETGSGPVAEAAAIGQRLAAVMIDGGANVILKEARMSEGSDDSE